MLLGGAPGAGKTALAMQWALDALRLSPNLRALVVNVETAPAALLDRQLSRLSGIPLATIRDREFGELHSERLTLGFDAVEAIADRLAFLVPPFDLPSIATAADDFGADLLLLDYAQRIDAGPHADKRNAMNVLMEYLRRFAGAGVGVLALAAVGRTKDAKGRSSYAAEGLGLASFRESSELEFGCDSAYMLSRGRRILGGADEADLRCLKNRHGEPRDLRLTATLRGPRRLLGLQRRGPAGDARRAVVARRRHRRMTDDRTLRGCDVLPPMTPAVPRIGSPTNPAQTEPNKGATGRFGVLNRFADEGARLVDTTAQACWWILYRETKPDGLATVSHQRIAECISVDRKTVTRALARLETARLLTVVRHGGWRRGPSTYRVHATPKRPRADDPPSTTREH